MSNTEIVNNIFKSIDEYIESLKDSIPNVDKIYSIDGSERTPNHSIKEWSVDRKFVDFIKKDSNGSIEYIWQPPVKRTNRRYTKQNIQDLQKFFDLLKDKETIKKIGYHIFIKQDNEFGYSSISSYAYFKDIDDKHYSFSKENLEPKIKELDKLYKDLYIPREGYTACTYCGKQIPNDKIIYRDIYAYEGMKKKLPFCSEECAWHQQDANEG